MINHFKFHNESIHRLVNLLFKHSEGRRIDIIRFCVACVEDIQPLVPLPEDVLQRKFIEGAIEFYNNYLENAKENGLCKININFTELTKHISVDDILILKNITTIYLDLLVIIYEMNNITTPVLRTVALDLRIHGLVDDLIKFRTDPNSSIGGFPKKTIEIFYKRLLNAFLSNCDFKIPIDKLNDSVDILMLIDILIQENIPIVEDGFITKGRINLPYYFNIKAEQDNIKNNFWLKQWFMKMFKEYD